MDIAKTNAKYLIYDMSSVLRIHGHNIPHKPQWELLKTPCTLDMKREEQIVQLRLNSQQWSLK